MNLDAPETPREKMEARLTAFLLGELSADEATTVRAAIARDKELSVLHDRLKETIELVREATVSESRAASEPAEKLKLSGERRQKLLAHFKTVRPKEFAPEKRHRFTLVELAAVVAIIALFAAMILPLFTKARNTSQSSAIINNLRQLDGAKQQWALETRQSPNAVPTFKDIQPYMGRGDNLESPPSVAGETYVLGKVSELPVAETGGKQIRLPSDGELALASPRSVSEFRLSAKAPATAAPSPPPLQIVLPSTDNAEAVQTYSLGMGGAVVRNDDTADDRSGSRFVTRYAYSPPAESMGDTLSLGGQGGGGAGGEIPPAAMPPGISGKMDVFDSSALNAGVESAKVPNLGDVPVLGNIGLGKEKSSVQRNVDRPGALIVAGKDETITEAGTAWGKQGAFRLVTPPPPPAPPPASTFKDAAVNGRGETTLALSGVDQGNGSSDKPYFGSRFISNGTRIAPEPEVMRVELAKNANEPTTPPTDTALQEAARRKVPARTLRPLAGPSSAETSREPQLTITGISTPKQQVQELGGKVRKLELDQLDLPVRKPATNAPIPQPEILTSKNNFSTFSLNVSDVSFKLAAASLEKGQMPDVASVRSEEFINAFDYRDPEPKAGASIAFAWERARYPFAHNRDLLRFSLKTAAAGRQAGRPLNVVLLLDNSGSMERADRVRIIREALRVLAGQLQAQDKLSVITFSRTARLVADGIAGDKAGGVTEQVSGLTPEGGTNLEDAMNLAYQTAAKHYLANGINRVVLLTDGAANLGDVEPESLKQKVEKNRKQGIALDCFGIGWEGFNDDLLEVLSRNGDGRYGFINSPQEAASEFAGQLAGALKVAASDVKVQVEFNPKRTTNYRQIGYAKHQLTKEQFRDNTVDAAEIAAQEAGNALYTVEVNPSGEGPLCTVRVRYKIPGTADYREQSWDVPYTGNALSLEQSSPAMRLAASASAFSEWLVASPFAAEVKPDALLGYLRGVPDIYGADTRPKKLEWMIRQAKSIARE